MGPNILEVGRSAILLGEPVRTLVELASLTPRALGRVRTVEIRNMVVSDIAEPEKEMYE